MGIIDIIVIIVVGGVIGWLASIVMRRDAQMGILMNVIVGVIGAFIGNFVGNMLLDRGTGPADFSLMGLLLSFVGAIVLLAIINMFQRGRVR